jgi:hypothetical protein
VIRKVVFRPEADEETRSVRRWDEAQRPGLGVRFADAIDETVEHITSNPFAFPAIHGELVGRCFVAFRTASIFDCLEQMSLSRR